jgi:hypothetical protein
MSSILLGALVGAGWFTLSASTIFFSSKLTLSQSIPYHRRQMKKKAE